MGIVSGIRIGTVRLEAETNRANRTGLDRVFEPCFGAKPPTLVPYKIAFAELLELRKQLKYLLDANLIQPSRAPCGTLVVF